MHYSTPLLLLSGATAALAGSFAAPAQPHHAIRQATRAQVVRRQAHGMHKVKRAGASPIPGICGANIPTALAVQFSGIDDTQPQFAYENYYGVFQPSQGGQVLVPTQSLDDATSLAMVGTSANSCNLRSSSQPPIIANTDGSDNSYVFYNSAAQISEFGATVGSCTTEGDEFSCAFADANQWNLCQFIDNGVVQATILSILGSTTTTAECTPVTVSYVAV